MMGRRERMIDVWDRRTGALLATVFPLEAAHGSG